jgi:glycosyltransferase involved in cell wall biosynthesis
LVIKIGRPELQAPLLQELAREVRHVDCKIIHGWLSREETLGLISACDLLVSLHRSEGFGLILAEAMGLGKPVVATGYSGNMDFMNTANSFLVNYALTTLDRDIGPYPAGFRWAEPDIQHAADLIGRILEDPQHAAAMGRRAAGDIAAQLSPEAVGRQIRQRLNLLGFSAAGNPRQPASASAHYDSGVMKMLPGEKVATLDVRAA